MYAEYGTLLFSALRHREPCQSQYACLDRNPIHQGCARVIVLVRMNVRQRAGKQVVEVLHVVCVLGMGSEAASREMA